MREATRPRECKDAAQVSQAGDPASYYSLIADSQAAQESQGDYWQCSVIRNITVTTVTGAHPLEIPGPVIERLHHQRLESLSQNHQDPRRGKRWKLLFPSARKRHLFRREPLHGELPLRRPARGVVKKPDRFLCGGTQIIVYSREYETATISCPPATSRGSKDGITPPTRTTSVAGRLQRRTLQRPVLYETARQE